MSQIWVIKQSYGGEGYPQGYVESESEAKAYCDWMNQEGELDDHYYYHPLRKINLAEERERQVKTYSVGIDGDGDLSHVEMRWTRQPFQESYELDCDDPDWLVFEFDFAAKTKEEVIKKAYDLVQQVKDHYAERGNWEAAIASIGGNLF